MTTECRRSVNQLRDRVGRTDSSSRWPRGKAPNVGVALNGGAGTQQRRSGTSTEHPVEWVEERRHRAPVLFRKPPAINSRILTAAENGERMHCARHSGTGWRLAAGAVEWRFAVWASNRAAAPAGGRSLKATFQRSAHSWKRWRPDEPLGGRTSDQTFLSLSDIATVAANDAAAQHHA